MLPPLDDYLSGRRKTLGFGVLEWGTKFLAHPDGVNMGGPWIFTNEQCHFVLAFYELNPDGSYVYRRAVLERGKGWGKSPFAAAIAAAELLGPVVFDHWGIDGSPIGRPNPSALVQIAAINEAQTENSYGPLMEMLSQGKAQKQYRLDIGLTRVLAGHGKKIEKVTASPRSREGRQTTFAICDETHLWVPSEHGHDLAAVIRRNLAKKDGRSIETTNAFRPGENSVAEASHEYAMLIEGGEIEETGLLYDSRRGHCPNLFDKDALFEALKYVYGDATWINKERIWREVNDPGNDEATLRRFYLNELHEGDVQWMRKPLWEANKRDKLKLKKDDTFALGFKGAVRNGAAGLVACRIRDGALFVLGLWEKPLDGPQDWEVPYLEVDTRVRKWLGKLAPKCLLLADPHQWQDIIGRWAVDYEDQVEEFWCRQKLKMAKAVEQFEEAVFAGRIRYQESDGALTRHVLNAKTEEISTGIGEDLAHVIRKENPGSSRYITLAQAAILAYEAAQLSVANGALEEKVSNEVYSF